MIINYIHTVNLREETAVSAEVLSLRLSDVDDGQRDQVLLDIVNQ